MTPKKPAPEKKASPPEVKKQEPEAESPKIKSEPAAEDVENPKPPPVPEKPKLKGHLSDEELAEWEVYFEEYAEMASANRPELSLMAGVGLMLLQGLKKR